MVVVVFVGIYQGVLVFDLDYLEDFVVEIDLNVVMIDVGGFIEVQGIVEGVLFCFVELNVMFELVQQGMQELFEFQCVVLVE